MISFKTTVRLIPTVDIITILLALEELSRKLNKVIVVTSGNDSTHMKNSRHYTNQALDIRSKGYPAKEMITFLASKLAPKYLILLESFGEANEHIHIELD